MILEDFVAELADVGDEDFQRELGLMVARVAHADVSLEAERVRGLMAADWLVRSYVPAWLHAAGLAATATRVAALPPVTDWSMLDAVLPTLREARREAGAAWAAARDAARAVVRDAAWDAAWAAAWAVARDAAWDAAWAAAGDAAGVRAAAWDAARAAARAAVWDAVRDAAWDAAGDALAPTVMELRSSALRLLDRMVEVRP